ncbi:MAG: AAA family ATPase [Candidatus Parabeggiatoa sp.]|nr:AAA family ATPase [Candidatus Parabeggiatoa sp.]
MKIKSFKLDDNNRNWHIEETHFDNFNLLVGISGVGKTKILKMLEEVCHVATEGEHKFNGMAWQMSFEHANHEYEWALKSALPKQNFSKNPNQSSIVYEKIVMKHDNQTVMIVDRSDNSFLFNGKAMPKLKKTESAITLLSEEPSIAPIADAFKKMLFSDTLQRKSLNALVNPEDLIVDETRTSFEQFKENSVQQPTVIKAYQFQALYKNEFNSVKQDIIDIFPSIEDIKVTVTKKAEGYDFYFNIKEKTSHEWISQLDMSSGLFRTLVLMTEISLAPRESVIIIDEFENSLGINCMPDLTDFVMSKAPLMQFILTSHHPYIISKMPTKTWKIIRRQGGQVSVINATDIPQLQKASRLNKFIQLAHLPEYEDGIL